MANEMLRFVIIRFKSPENESELGSHCERWEGWL